jgi:FeS assembly SUF system regulator
MLKLGKLADYGTMIVTVLAGEPDRLLSAHDLANRTHVAAPTVSKLLKLLTRGGLVESLRGARGGYKLARSADDITVADVIAAIDGPIGLTECSVHKGDCAVESSCGVRSNWRLISSAIHQALKSVTLAEMAKPMRRRPGESRDPESFVMTFQKTLGAGLRRHGVPGDE